MDLTIDKLAIPRKQSITRQTATYAQTYTSDTHPVINGYVTLETPLTPTNVVRYYPRIYEGKPPDAPSMSEYLCYAEVYASTASRNTRMADLTKGRLLYSTEVTSTVDNINVLKIRCEKPDGTSFLINPGYYLGSGLYCVGIHFKDFYWYPYSGDARLYNENDGIAPARREVRTSDNVNFEVAIAPTTFKFSVEIDVYNASRHEMVDSRVVNNLDYDSYMGRGGLYNYWVCIGADYKDKNAAALDPSGRWYTEDKVIKTDIDINATFT